MKILLVAAYPKEACPVFTFEFARALRKNRCDIYTILPTDVINNDVWKKELPSGKIFYIDNSVYGNKIFRFFFKCVKAIKFVLIDRKNMPAFKFDYVIYTFYHRWNFLIDKCINAENRLMIVHDPIQHSGEPLKQEKQHQRQVKSMDGVILLSKKFIPILENNYDFKGKIIYMPHGIMKYGQTNPDYQNQYESNSNFNFLFFGRITKYKGLEYLLKSFRKLETKYNNIELTIAGSGDFSEYEKLFKELRSAKLVNCYIKDEDVSNFFRVPNTILVLPYIDATQSGVISIAYAYGVPIVATKTGGLVEQLDDGKLGVFCDPRSIDGLILAMEKYITHPNLYNEQAEKMLSQSRKLNWNSIVKHLLEEFGA